LDTRQATERGSPQGGVQIKSTDLRKSNHGCFDQFMKKPGGHRIVRYADDILILVGSRAARKDALK